MTNRTLGLCAGVLAVVSWTAAGCKSSSTDDGGKAGPPAAVEKWESPKGITAYESGAKFLGQVERNAVELDKLLPPSTKIEVVAEGFDWSEGPVWDAQGGYLVFSDVPQNVAYAYKPVAGVREFLRPSGYTTGAPRAGESGSNGLTRDDRNRLVLCQHGDRRVARLEANGNWTTLADRFEGKRFNSPNDLCFDNQGNLFFTDPPYGLEGGLKSPKKELDFQGVYRRSADGKLTLLTKDIKFPNGIALSPDEKTLYVAESNPERPVIWAHDLKADGTLANPRVLFDAKPLADKKLKGLPDGLKVDVHGNLWATGPGGVLVISPEGKHLGTILTGQATGNCAWGDDGSSLYINADMYLCRVKTSTRGVIPGAR